MTEGWVIHYLRRCRCKTVFEDSVGRTIERLRYVGGVRGKYEENYVVPFTILDDIRCQPGRMSVK